MKVGALGDFDGATPQSGCDLQQRSSITSVGPDVFDSAPSPLSEERGQGLLGPIPVLKK
jgi:hypothetical protein